MTTPHLQPQSKFAANGILLSPRTTLVIFVKGFCMGASDVVPGVSGGTMALILGIYEDLIHAIKSFDTAFLRLVFRGRLVQAIGAVQITFLVPLGIGILTAIFTLARGLSYLLVHHPVAIWSFFFGLVLASALLVGKRIHRWSSPTVACLVVAALGAYFLVGLVPVHTPETLPFIFLCGAIAICAMILPGISGSFILVLLGKYQFILDAVGQLDLLILAVFAAGTATGIILFVRILNWLLKYHHEITMAALTGLMLGSLRKVWPWKASAELVQGRVGDVTVLVNVFPHEISNEVLLAFGLALLGAVMVVLLQRLADQ
jgi:putative membrane protein